VLRPGDTERRSRCGTRAVPVELDEVERLSVEGESNTVEVRERGTPRVDVGVGQGGDECWLDAAAVAHEQRTVAIGDVIDGARQSPSSRSEASASGPPPSSSSR